MNKVSFTGSDLSVFKWANTSNNNTQRSTNPFTNVFKSNSLTSDVFQKSNAQDVITLKDSLRRQADKLSVAFNGTVNQTKETFSRMFEPMNNFLNSVRNNASELWRKANETHISFSGLTQRSQSSSISSDVRELMNKPVSELRDMLVSEVTLV